MIASRCWLTAASAFTIASVMVVVSSGATAGAPFDLRLVDVTADSGIDFTHENSPTTQKYLIETMGGGVAVLDYDSDGWLDLFFTNGAQLSAPMPPEAHTSKTDRFANRLYRNRHDGTFADVTRAANVGGIPGGQYGMGVAVGDYDNDGFADLYVTGYDANTLYHNDGHGRFDDVDSGERASRGADGGCRRSSSISTTTDGSICSSHATWTGASDARFTAARGGQGSGILSPPARFRPSATSSIAAIVMARSRTSAAGRVSPP